MKVIGKGAFESCYALNSVSISDIAAWCEIEFNGFFSNPLCYSRCLKFNGVEIKNLVIPNSATHMVPMAFAYCENLTSVTIGDGVTSIGEEAFYGCTGITSVTIGNNVTTIGDNAFSGCSSLTSVRIGNNVTTIGDGAFFECSSLTSIVYPNSVTTIGGGVINGCVNLKFILYGKGVTNVGSSPFPITDVATIVSLNSTPPAIGFIGYDITEDLYPTIWVPKGSRGAYMNSNRWDYFPTKIREIPPGDADLNGVVDDNDLNAVAGFVMGRETPGFYRSLSDLNDDNKVNAVDVVKLVNQKQ